MKLTEVIKQERIPSVEQESLFSIIVTSNWLISRLAARMAPFGVTQPQYNVLRILRGSYPKRLTCSDVGHRLLNRMPDVTRLLTRLERAGLVRRERSGEDRRVVEVAITEKGLDLLKAMNDDIDDEVARLTRHLSPQEHRQLCDLLERMRLDQSD